MKNCKVALSSGFIRAGRATDNGRIVSVTKDALVESAADSGTTFVVCPEHTNPSLTTRESLKKIIGIAKRKAIVDLRINSAITSQNLEELPWNINENMHSI